MKPKIVIVTNHPEDVRIIRPGQRMVGIRASAVFVADDVEPHGRSAAEVAKLIDWFERGLMWSLRGRDNRVYGWAPREPRGARPKEWQQGRLQPCVPLDVVCEWSDEVRPAFADDGTDPQLVWFTDKTPATNTSGNRINRWRLA